MRTVDVLLTQLARASKHGYVGGPVSQLEHALQCARLAHDEGGDDLMVAAALLHDIGHLVGTNDSPDVEGLGVREHERVGADYLRSIGMHEAVCELVAGHVSAKRYLVTRDASYAAQLSSASVRTLAVQGGPMTELEALSFERSWSYDRLLRLRRCDDRAKVAGKAVPGLPRYAPLLSALLFYAQAPERRSHSHTVRRELT